LPSAVVNRSRSLSAELNYKKAWRNSKLFCFLIYTVKDMKLSVDVVFKAVAGNDVGEFEGNVVLLERLNIAFTKVREDNELGVDVFEDLGCLVCRQVDQLGNYEIEMRFEGDLWEIVEIVGKVTREEYALALVGLNHIGIAWDARAAMLGANSGHADTVIFIEGTFRDGIRVELGVSFGFCPMIEAVNTRLLREIAVKICFLMIPKAARNGGELCGVVAVHVRYENGFYARDRNAVIVKQIDNGSAGVNEEAVALVFKIDRRAKASDLGVTVACA